MGRPLSHGATDVRSSSVLRRSMRILQGCVPRICPAHRGTRSCTDEPSAHPWHHEFNLLAMGVITYWPAHRYGALGSVFALRCGHLHHRSRHNTLPHDPLRVSLLAYNREAQLSGFSGAAAASASSAGAASSSAFFGAATVATATPLSWRAETPSGSGISPT
jgi:hypothetical protein